MSATLDVTLHLLQWLPCEQRILFKMRLSANDALHLNGPVSILA